MKAFPFLIVSAFAILLIAGCTSGQQDNQVVAEYENLPAGGFNVEGSDPKAIEIADQVMDAMGGRSNWDKTRYVCWNFFGARELIWDKQTGDVRIESDRDSTIYILNIHTMEGRVHKNGEEITQPDSLTNYLERGKQIWINDSYWLVMPYKLKDSGVTLKYLGEDTTQSGLQSDVLELRFENVGVTPDNKYNVWVDKETLLIRQWAYYRNDTLAEPGFILPWNEWRQYNNILLSGNRGERELSDIMVLDSLPENTFLTFDSVNLPGIE